MSLESLKSDLGPFAKDTKLNLSTMLIQEQYHDLSQTQRWGTVLSCVFFLKDKTLARLLLSEVKQHDVFGPDYIEALKAAASLMAMNNVYYRSMHLMSDEELSKRPVGLRMNVMRNPGIPKGDFELYSLALSALSGCGLCLKAHQKTLQAQEGVTLGMIQGVLKIASIMNAASCAHLLSTDADFSL